MPSQPKSYDHSRKAGNRGDVWKHFILTAIADGISANSRSFHYVDCHAGAPVHDLDRVHAVEWKHGVGTLLANKKEFDNEYVNLARKFHPLYPSGWLFAVNSLARRFESVRATLFDTDGSFSEQYSLSRDHNFLDPMLSNIEIEFRAEDGYKGHRRIGNSDWVFFDPPFAPKAAPDWKCLRAECRQLKLKQRTFAAWYPFFWPTEPQKLSSCTVCEAWEAHWDVCGSKPSQNLKGCGILVSDDLASILRDREAELGELLGRLGWRLVRRSPK